MPVLFGFQKSIPVFVLYLLSLQVCRLFIAPVDFDTGVIIQGVLGLYAVSSWWVSETLGMQLITLLTRQLRGTLQVGLMGGTCFQIEFAEVKAAKKAIR